MKIWTRVFLPVIRQAVIEQPTQSATCVCAAQWFSRPCSRVKHQAFLLERLEGVTGFTGPKLPAASSGMEVVGRTEPYQVIAFGYAGRRVFSDCNKTVG